MAELFLAFLAFPVACGMLMSFFLEQLLVPRPRPVWLRSPFALTLHLGLWLLLFAFELALFLRPWFSVAMVLAFMLPIILVSNAKYHSLHEPFIFQDFEYFIDAVRHPRLYLPFLNMSHVAAVAVLSAVSAVAGLSLEPSLIGAVEASDILVSIALLVVIGSLLVWIGAQRRQKLAFVPGDDLGRLGLLSYLWHYASEERHLPPSLPAGRFDVLRRRDDRKLPDLIAVQSESFFDVRRAYASVLPEILGEYDGLRRTARAYGTLAVPAWGANTVRTEFAFLSGRRLDALGIHQFNPYRKLAKRGIHTIATYLKRLGYRTICVHPYPASFYRRDVVYPMLGFDQFVDISGFGEEDKSGPYVGDMAVADKVCSCLREASGQPVFIYAITMENHGPLHLERVVPGERETLFSAVPPAGCDDLTIYLRHLANADRMIGRLRAELEALPHEAGLCWFGDHVPIMPNVYALMGKPDGRTDYLIWKNGGVPVGVAPQDLEVEELAGLFMSELRLFD